jgi:hypothetical protein
LKHAQKEKTKEHYNRGAQEREYVLIGLPIEVEQYQARIPEPE